MDDEELVTIAKFEFANEAELAKLHLEEAGIKAYLADAETVNWEWFLGNAIGYIKVQVASSQAEAAAQVLADHAPTTTEADTDTADEEKDEPTKCLSCGQELPDAATQCPSCGWTYEGEPEPEVPPAPEPTAEDAPPEVETTASEPEA
ncbi:MAG: hypothetical protein HYR84_08175 [Planctomycetes bacterium]|nr:hypothetical protein [Planctomycetota bacterium]